jgi:hypothetical protein
VGLGGRRGLTDDDHATWSADHCSEYPKELAAWNV